MKKQVSFTEGSEPVFIDEGDNLSEALNIENSPILFGCRTGICGTCIVHIMKTEGPLPALTEAELDYFEMMEVSDKNVRLACQLNPKHNICLKKYKD